MSLRTYLQGRLQEAQAFDSEGQPGRERDEVGNHAPAPGPRSEEGGGPPVAAGDALVGTKACRPPSLEAFLRLAEPPSACERPPANGEYQGPLKVRVLSPTASGEDWVPGPRGRARLKAQESSRIVAKRKGLEIRAAQQFSQLAAAKRDRLAARRRALRKENAKRAGCAALEIPNDTRSNGGNGL